jgi:hypothetical protein
VCGGKSFAKSSLRWHESAAAARRGEPLRTFLTAHEAAVRDSLAERPRNPTRRQGRVDPFAANDRLDQHEIVLHFSTFCC